MERRPASGSQMSPRAVEGRKGQGTLWGLLQKAPIHHGALPSPPARLPAAISFGVRVSARELWRNPNIWSLAGIIGYVLIVRIILSRL